MRPNKCKLYGVILAMLSSAMMPSVSIADNHSSDTYLTAVRNKEYTEAIKLAEIDYKANPKGLAASTLGYLYANGYGVDKNITKAFLLMQPAIEANEPTALSYAGMLYVYGDDPYQDVNKGVSLLEKAASLGDAEAPYQLSLLYMRGKVVTADYKKAVEYALKAANDFKDGDAAYNLYLLYSNGLGVEQDENMAVDWLKKSADDGSMDGKVMLAKYYLYDNPYLKPDNKKAYDLLMESIKYDVPEAYYVLANMYIDGQGVKDDAENSHVWTYMEKAASLGYEDAIVYLITCKFANFLKSGEQIEVHLLMKYLLAYQKLSTERLHSFKIIYNESYQHAITSDKAKLAQKLVKDEGNTFAMLAPSLLQEITDTKLKDSLSRTIDQMSKTAHEVMIYQLDKKFSEDELKRLDQLIHSKSYQKLIAITKHHQSNQKQSQQELIDFIQNMKELPKDLTSPNGAQQMFDDVIYPYGFKPLSLLYSYLHETNLPKPSNADRIERLEAFYDLTLLSFYHTYKQLSVEDRQELNTLYADPVMKKFMIYEYRNLVAFVCGVWFAYDQLIDPKLLWLEKPLSA